MTPSITFTVPIKTVNESNGDKGMAAHWRKTKLRKQAHYAVDLVTAPIRRPTRFPVVVRISRFSAGTLDDDGLRSATKAIRDAVAKWIGVDDGDVERVGWDYHQEPCRRGEYGVRVEVFERARLVVEIKEAS
jgi:hypothetical protein